MDIVYQFNLNQNLISLLFLICYYRLTSKFNFRIDLFNIPYLVVFMYFVYNFLMY